LGIFTASDNGIPTSRDVSTGNTATEIRFDGLKEAEYSLKSAYRRLAQWIFHRDAIKQISKLKDGEGRYIWQPSVQIGQPDRLLNMAINESEYAPNTFTTGCYVGILGDFRNYWIVDALTMTIQVLLELYAAKNQNGYISRAESDGMPVLGEAFSRVKLG
jgi:HK97 family phage major capsid protein